MTEQEQPQEDELTYNAEEPQPSDVNKKRKPSAWKCWLRMWATPIAGFKAIRQSRMAATTMESEVYYPMLALVATGAFARKFYFPDTEISACLIDAVCVFVAFFISYFLVFPIGRLLMRSDCAAKVDTPFGHCYVSALMATLALFYFLYECLPFLEVLLAFTPAYTIYLSYKGMTVFNLPESRRISTWVALILMIVALPLMFYELLVMMLPANIEPR